MTRLRAQLTYANVMATVAVFIALGGTSYAAIKVTGKNVKNSSLTGADIKKNSVTGQDVKRLGAADFKKGVLRTGATGRPGARGPAGANGTALAYGRVAGNASLTESKNATVRPGSGASGSFCIDVTVPGARNIVATPADFAVDRIVVTMGPEAVCPAGTEATVKTYNDKPAIDPQPFYFLVN